MVFEGRGYFERERYTLLKRLLRQGLGEILSRDSFKMYASSEEIRFHLNPNLDDAVFARMLSDLCECGKLQEINGGYRIPHMIVKTTSRREMLIEKLEQFALRQGRASFCVGTFHNLHEQDFTYREVEQVVHHLHARKKLVRFKDGRFLSAGIMEEIKDGVRELIRRKGRLELQDAREILGYGRTRAIPLLDYLDGVGLTRRVGEFRVLCQEQRGEGDLTDGGSAIKRGGRLEEIA
jgi:selenocysteine-specific elongation factor